MGWFSRKPKSPPEQVYSHTGTAVWQMLLEDRSSWGLLSSGDLWHGPSSTVVSADPYGVRIRCGGDEVGRHLTTADGERLRNEAMTLRMEMKLLEDAQVADRLRRTQRPLAGSFDATARSLALAVIGGDIAAAHGLFDYFIDHPELLEAPK